MFWPFSLLPRVRNPHRPARRPHQCMGRQPAPPPRPEELEPRVLLTNQVYLPPGQPGQTVAARFDLLTRAAAARDEFGLIRLDDAVGHINGLAPGDPGYAAAALAAARRQVVFTPRQKRGAVTNLQLASGASFALYLIRNATAASFLARNPSNRPGKGPVAFFSLGSANPLGRDHVVQRGADGFAFDDAPKGDHRFNDVVGRLRFGAPQGTPTPPVIPPVPPPADSIGPALQARLAHDTAAGGTNNDGITSDPAVTGSVTDTSGVASFHAGFDATQVSGFVDVLADLRPGGGFTLDRARLDQVNGGPLADGAHTLHLRAADARGNPSAFDLSFTLDTATPADPVFDLDPGSDSAPVGDQQTTFSTVTLAGTTEANVALLLEGSGRTTTADATGHFTFTGVALTLGANPFTVRATDVAGNSRSHVTTITRLELPGGFTLAEGSQLVTQMTVPVNLPTTDGSHKLRFTVTLHFDRTDTAPAVEDLFLVYVVDPANPSQTLLQRDDPGTAVFALAGATPEFRPGQVRFDGTTVEIDVTPLAPRTSALLVFQLLNSDADTGTMIDVGRIDTAIDTQGSAAPVFPGTDAAAAKGPALDLAALAPAAGLRVQLTNVRFDTATGRYTADLRLRNDGSAAVGRSVAVVFLGLPAGVQLLNPSGTDGGGNPYVNFHDAIPTGGLAPGVASAAIEVVFTDAGAVRFSLVPQVLVGAPNRPPVLDPVGPLSTLPGGRVAVILVAADPDGDAVAFSLRSAGRLPAGELRADGTLVFTPAVADIGSYTFTVAASDGALEATRSVTLTVDADVDTSTRVSGVVQDAFGQPLADVTVEFDTYTTTTADDGSFTVGPPQGFALANDTLRVRGDLLAGPTSYPLLADRAALLLGHDVFAGANSVLPRPLRLVAVDTAHAVTINPAQDTTVTTAALPGASLLVTAGNLHDNGGTLYAGPLSLTEVPRPLFTPLLPNTLRPDLVLLVHPGALAFTTPAPLTLPNRAGWQPNTVLDLWSLNPQTGQLEDVGDGRVSGDGSVITTSAGGVRATSWLFFVPPAPATLDPAQDAFNADTGAAEDTATAAFASEVELHSGAVLETHALVTYQSLGAARGVVLRYDSLRADARPIVHVGVDDLAPSDASRLLLVQLTLTRDNFRLAGSENPFRLPEGGGDVEAAVQADLHDQPSGVYHYQLSTFLGRPGSGGDPVGTATPNAGGLVHVNSNGSPFGNGWGVAGLQEIVDNPDGSVLLIDGDGSELVFHADSGGFVPPLGDFSTLVQDAGLYRRTLKDSTVYEFNAGGRLSRITDRNHNVTEYVYDAGHPERLTRLIDPTLAETVFAYDDVQHTVTITDPANRPTVLQLDAAGNLARVTDPDGSHRDWDYDACHRMTRETDKRGFVETDEYNAVGRAMIATHDADGSVIHIEAAQSQCILPDPAEPNLPPMACLRTGVQAFVADANGGVTVDELDRNGQLIGRRDALGSVLQQLTRDQQNQVTQLLSERGFVNGSYDSKGNLIRIADSVSAPYGFAASRFANALAAADLNGDSRPDLVYLDPNAGHLAVLLGNGDGTFQPAKFYAAAGASDGASQALALGRFNGDAFPDVAVMEDGGVTVYLNRGDGSFQTGATYAVGAGGLNAIVAGLLNGDQTIDLAVTDAASDSVILLRGQGNGAFAAAGAFATNPFPGALAAGDLNNDGRMDLAVFSLNPFGTQHANTALLANGSGGFTRDDNLLPPNGSNNSQFFASAAVADLIPGGFQELVLGDSLGFQQVHARGPLGYSAIYSDYMLAVVTSVAVANINGDAFLDIVNARAVLYGDGATFQPEFYSFEQFGFFPRRIAVADFDGNGLPDIAAVGEGGTGTVLLSTVGGFQGGAGTARQYTYESAFNQLTSEVDEIGRQTLNDIDPANGNVLARRLVVGQPDTPANGETDDLVTRYTYTSQGLVDTETDPLGRVTDYDYNDRGLVETITYAKGAADEGVRHYEYDPAGTGNQTAVIDENGHRSEFKHDAMNRLIEQRDALMHVSSTRYDDAGRILSQTDALGNVTATVYDDPHRLVTTTFPDPDGPGGPQPAPVKINEYDADGNLKRTFQTDTDHPTGPPLTQTSYTSNVRGQVKTETDARGGVTVSDYDDFGNRKLIIDPDGNRTEFHYDARGNLIEEKDPRGKSILFKYNAADQRTEKIDRDGRLTKYDYDRPGNVITETWVGPGGAAANVLHFTNDLAGNRLSASDSFSSLAFTYDGRDRLQTADNNGTPGVPRVLLIYAYDPAGNLLSVRDTINGQPGGRNDYLPDELNRVSRLTQTGTGVSPKRVDFTYDAVGRFETIARFADLTGTSEVATSTYQNDRLGRLTNLDHRHGASVLATYTYTFDATSRLTRIVDVDGTVDFAYDATGQLTSATYTDPNNPDRTYTWDANGNPTGAGFAIDPGNRLHRNGTFTYDYDDEGNLIKRTEDATGAYRVFEWDYRNRLVKVTDFTAANVATQVVRYTYDALNRRIAKDVNGTVTRFVYDRDDVLLEFTGGGTAPSMRYLHGPAVDQVLAQEDFLETDASLRVLWMLPDHLGSIRDLVDTAGSVRNHVVYDPFGKIILQTHPQVQSRYLFTGREFDEETGLYYYRARYYDPVAHRFLNEDPSRFAAGDSNLLRYVRNRPISALDPTGEFTNNGSTVEISTPGTSTDPYKIESKDTSYQFNETDYSADDGAVPGAARPFAQGAATLTATGTSSSSTSTITYAELLTGVPLLDAFVALFLRNYKQETTTFTTSVVQVTQFDATNVPLHTVTFKKTTSTTAMPVDLVSSSVGLVLLTGIGLLAASKLTENRLRRKRKQKKRATPLKGKLP
jgi:RHS repeat-associated protein